MMALLKLFWEICLFRKGPQDVPASGALLLLLLLVMFYLVLDIVNSWILVPEKTWLLLLAMTALYQGVLFASLSLLMYLLGYYARILQTLSALTGIGVILSVCSLPFLLMIRGNEGNGGFVVIIPVIQIWDLFISAHILSKALNIHTILAGVLAFGYYMLGFRIVGLFFPQGG